MTETLFLSYSFLDSSNNINCKTVTWAHAYTYNDNDPIAIINTWRVNVSLTTASDSINMYATVILLHSFNELLKVYNQSVKRNICTEICRYLNRI